MKEHSANALAVATFLEAHPKVLKVNYPGLKSHKNHDNATRYLKNSMASGLLSFEVATREDAEKIVNNVKLFSLVVNIGDSKSIITHPASTTHQQLSSEELQACGIAQGLVRLSVGIEDCDDLISDLKTALSTLG
jgi:O-acetylhomoserine (thiol)-lyase